MVRVCQIWPCLWAACVWEFVSVCVGVCLLRWAALLTWCQLIELHQEAMFRIAEGDKRQALKDHVQEPLLLVVDGPGLLSL